ncbi:MAG: hypothetical protein HZA92_00145 [Verrucomicrobia bacterium]|nr:hypothetical protein [Verrucomicrobiota bacterium]
MCSTTLGSRMSPVADWLDAGPLRTLLLLRAVPNRIAWPAKRASEGQFTTAERGEGEGCILFVSSLGLLQSEARHKLTAAG